MRKYFLVAVLLSVGVEAFAPAPIRWGGPEGLSSEQHAPSWIHSHRFVIAPASGAALHSGTVPQALTIGDPLARTPPQVIPHFTAKPDNTIAWGAKGLCMEVSGVKSGAAVRINHCSGGGDQKWNWLPWGPIQLKGTNQCLDVPDASVTESGTRVIGGVLNGARIELRECQNKLSETWKLEDPFALAQDPTPHLDTLAAIRHVMISIAGITLLGALGLSAWVWRRPHKAREVVTSESGMSRRLGHGDVSLTEVPAVMALGPVQAEENRQGPWRLPSWFPWPQSPCPPDIAEAALTSYDPALIKAILDRAAEDAAVRDKSVQEIGLLEEQIGELKTKIGDVPQGWLDEKLAAARSEFTECAREAGRHAATLFVAAFLLNGVPASANAVPLPPSDLPRARILLEVVKAGTLPDNMKALLVAETIGIDASDIETAFSKDIVRSYKEGQSETFKSIQERNMQTQERKEELSLLTPERKDEQNSQTQESKPQPKAFKPYRSSDHKAFLMTPF